MEYVWSGDDVCMGCLRTKCVDISDLVLLNSGFTNVYLVMWKCSV
ncbi:hypothetical protein [Methanobrevibacter sp.]